MAKMPSAVILDSSGLVSLLEADDQLHPDALRIVEAMKSSGWRLLLPYEVYAETLNVFGKKNSRAAAVLAGRIILDQYSNQRLAFISTEPSILRRALELQGTAPGSPSFVDCLVMAIADDQATPYIFGFDATFKKNGYRRPDADGFEDLAA